MSFSSDLKKELSKVGNLANKELIREEIIGYLISGNTLVKDKVIKFSTESDYNINRFGKLLNNLEGVDYGIRMFGNTYSILVDQKDVEKAINIELPYVLKNENQEVMKNIIRGAYLGSGSINNPEFKYHIEFTVRLRENANYIQKSLQEFGIKVGIVTKKDKFMLYSKDGGEVSKILALLGANKTVLKYEEIRVERDMNNKVNRMVNCEAGNLNKTINASIKQTEAIKKLKANGEFEKLEDTFKEIANLRLEHPNANYTELGLMLKEPVGKSGAAYRLKMIMRAADGK